jgi:dihydroorotate dehydrogenase electron transfer subunit
VFLKKAKAIWTKGEYMARLLNEEIRHIEEIASGIFKMEVESAYISARALPGQFINVQCCSGIDVFLRRPISICSANGNRGTFTIVFKVIGKGTRYLSQKQAGSTIDLIGPLGTSFDLSEEFGRIAVVGGGIGIFPLLFLLQEKKGSHKTAFIGFRNMELSVLTKEFKNSSHSFLVSTDDGSLGYKGSVIELLKKEIDNGAKYDIIYTCGPEPMLREVVSLTKEQNIKCQVSLEQRMACGIGACLVCACKTRHNEGWQYSHVCKDGPVFWSDEVILEE